MPKIKINRSKIQVSKAKNDKWKNIQKNKDLNQRERKLSNLIQK